MEGPYMYIAVNDDAYLSGDNRFELERAHALRLPVYVGVETDEDLDPVRSVMEPRVVAGGSPGPHYELLVAASPDVLTPVSPEQRYPRAPLLRAAWLDDLFEETDDTPGRCRFFQVDQQSRVVGVLDHDACYGPEFGAATVMPYFVGAVPEMDVLKLRAQQLHGRELQRSLGVESLSDIAATADFRHRLKNFLYHWADFGSSEETLALRSELSADISAITLLAPFMTPRQYAFHT